MDVPINWNVEPKAMSPTDLSALLNKVQAKWTAIGLSTDAVDRGRSESAIEALYLGAGLGPPRIMQLRSPKEAATKFSKDHSHVGETIASRFPKVGSANLPYMEWPIVWKMAQGYTIRIHEAYDQVANDVDRLEYDDFRSGEAMERRVTEAIWTRLGQLIDDAASFSDIFSKGSLNTRSHLGGLAFYEFWGAYLGNSFDRHPVGPLLALGEAAGWIVPFQYECWIVDRPERITGHLAQDNEIARFWDGSVVYAGPNILSI
jgi:hypothetical protein